MPDNVLFLCLGSNVFGLWQGSLTSPRRRVPLWSQLNFFLKGLRRSLQADLSRSLEIRAVYIVYRIWLTRNRAIFEAYWQPARFILERALMSSRKIMDVLSTNWTSIIWDTWDSSDTNTWCLLLGSLYSWIFLRSILMIVWEALKVVLASSFAILTLD